MQHLYRKIYADKNFHALEKRRSRLNWSMTLIVLLGYFTFILIIAFSPELLTHTITEDSVITWGIPIGVSIITISFLLTGLYVWYAKKIDQKSQQLIQHHLNSKDQE